MVYDAIAAAGGNLYIQAYIALAFVSALAFLYLGRRWSIPNRFVLVHFFIVTWSGLMYLNFLAPSVLSDFAWYADWMISTPLIVTALAFTAMHESETRWDLIGGLVGLQFMLIVTGVISQSTGMNYAYWVGNALLIGVFYLLWGPLKKIAEDGSEELARSYKRLAGYITIFFVLYPVVWYASGLTNPGSVEALGALETSLAFVVLPLFCKQIYGFIDLYLIHRLEG
jgi:bacteriorhodopsin